MDAATTQAALAQLIQQVQALTATAQQQQQLIADQNAQIAQSAQNQQGTVGAVQQLAAQLQQTQTTIEQVAQSAAAAVQAATVAAAAASSATGPGSAAGPSAASGSTPPPPVPPGMASTGMSFEAIRGILDKLGKPGKFVPGRTEYVSWEFNFLGYLGTVSQDLRTMAVTALSRTSFISPPTDPKNVAENNLLYYALSQLLEGAAAKMVRRVEKQNGAEAFRVFGQRYGSRDYVGGLAILTNLVKFEFGGDIQKFEEALSDFMLKVQEHDEHPDTTPMDSELKKALLISGAPEPLRSHLQLNAASLNWDQMVNTADAFLRAKRAGDSMPTQLHTPKKWDDNAMDVSYVQKGKGKKGKDGHHGGKKGDGQGKGGWMKHEFQGNCLNCGTWGHKAANCWKGPGAGKGDQGGKAGKGKGDKGKGKGKKGKDGKKGKGKGTYAIEQDGYWPESWEAQSPFGSWDYWPSSEVVQETPPTQEMSPAARAAAPLTPVKPIASLEKCNSPGSSGGTPKRFVWVIVEINSSFGIRDNDSSIEFLMIDSGTYDNVCPPTFAEHIPIRDSGKKIRAEGADASSLIHYGTKSVPIYIMNMHGQWIQGFVEFQVHNVKRAMLGTGALSRKGVTTTLGPRRNCLEWNQDEFNLEIHGDHAWLPCWIDRSVVAPVEDMDGDELPTYVQPFNPDDYEFTDNEEVVEPPVVDRENEAEDTLHGHTPSVPTYGHCPVASARQVRFEEDPEILDASPVGEGRVAKGILAPKEPSPDEKAKHELTHWPYRSWCGWCVQSRGHDDHHKRSDAERAALAKPMLQIDYFFMRTVFEKEILTCISGIERKSGACIASAVPVKGDNDFVVGLLCQALEKWGMNNSELIIQNDQEDAITAVSRSVAKRRVSNTTIRVTPKKSKGSLAYAEQLHRSLEGLARTFRGQIESSCTVTITSQSQITPWLVRHASFVLTNFNVRPNGKTPHEILHNVPYISGLCVIGEAVLIRIPDSDVHAAKLSDNWTKAIWLGRTISSDEHIGATPLGIIVGRSCRRQSLESRWDRELLLSCTGLPWMREGQKDRDFAQNKGNPLAWQPQLFRQATINLNAFWTACGKTAGCPACQLGPSGRHHSRECKEKQSKWMKAQRGEEGDAEFREVVIEGRRTAQHQNSGPIPQQAYLIPPGASSSGIARDANGQPIPDAGASSAVPDPVASGAAAPATPAAPKAGTKTKLKIPSTRAIARASARLQSTQSVPVPVPVPVQQQIALPVPTTAAQPLQPMQVDSVPSSRTTSDGKKQRVDAICEVLAISVDEEKPFTAEKPEPPAEGAFDDGKKIDGLPAALVQAGDEKELDNMSKLGVFEWIREEDIPQGEHLIGTSWARKMKGAEVRSRCVLQDFATCKRDDVFAPTPCPTAVRVLLLYGLVYDLKIESADLMSAFMQAPCRKPMYARPPKSIRQAGWAWKILKAMNGGRTSMGDFGEHFAQVLVECLGLRRGIIEPCSFMGPGTLRVVIHVDDPIAAGSQEELDEFWDNVSAYFLLRRCGTLGEGDTITFLGREYTRFSTPTEIGFMVRHSQKYLDSCEAVYGYNSKTKVKKSMKRTDIAEGDDEPLGAWQHSQFRSATGKLQFMSCERLDLKYGTKNLAHMLAKPTIGSEKDAKFILKYLQGTRNEFQFLKLNKNFVEHVLAGNFSVDVFTDSDWAGNLEDRSSTSCCYNFIGDFLVEPTVVNQDATALSSFEAEYISAASGAKDSLFVRGLLAEFRFPLVSGMETWRCRLFVDSSAAKSNIERMGPTKRTRHLDVRFHFIQRLRARGLLKTGKILGTESPADLGTKFLAGDYLEKMKIKCCLGDIENVHEMGPLVGDERRFSLPDGSRWKLCTM